MKNINPLGLFDDHFLLEKLTKLGDPLKKLNEFIDWKIFESPINETFKACSVNNLIFQLIIRKVIQTLNDKGFEQNQSVEWGAPTFR